uniref:Uncharacterized protein n=1 Tax=Arundo donax TaxID=35708 RepID=A0A0A8ZX49_ARUDO
MKWVGHHLYSTSKVQSNIFDSYTYMSTTLFIMMK